ncbi:hypothetical protein YIM1640_11090 [Thermus oshimai]|jgi:predicted nucleic acid-binding protein
MPHLVYLDTSALVKRYVEEEGSLEVRSLFEEGALLSTSALTRVEMAAALRKEPSPWKRPSKLSRPLKKTGRDFTG